MNELNLNKLKMQTPNKCEENIEKLKELFPQIVSEKKIDFDILKQLLSDTIVEADDERYRLDWVGKKASLLKSNTPIYKTLRPCEDESVDFENTQNLYIEGDNFEVLKVLSESYLNKIKMIYIDPPYNTGKDFVYRDNFTKSKNDFENEIGLRDEEGNKLFKNTDSNGRFHSDWLSMMYERLLVARDLLKDDGLTFISIDENEYENLKKVCDEIFGEDNYIGSIIWKNKFGSGAKTSGFIGVHEYIVCYSRIKIMNITSELSESEVKKHTKKDEKYETRGGYRIQPLMTKSMDDRPNLVYPLEYNGIKIHPNKQWVWSKERMMEAIANNNVDFMIKDDGTVAVNSKQYLKDENGFMRKGKPTTFFDKVYTQNGTKELSELFNKKIFDFNKPIELIRYLISFELNDTITINDNDIILDFFSGSATTAHAVMNLNAQDGGNRKFIMVQLPEITDEKSEAYKAGYKNICEIGKERIRRAGKKIKEENKDKENIQNLDIGFRVLKVDSTNFKEVYYHPNKLGQEQLKMFESNIKEDRSDLDLLFAVMIDLGIELSLKITTKILSNKKLYLIENSELIACFENDITLSVIEEIIAIKPYQVVLKDGCFANDNDKINAMQKLADITTVSVI